MVSLAFILIIFAGVVTVTILLILFLVKLFKKNKENTDLKAGVADARTRLAAQKSLLLPWTNEEMELLSLKEVEQQKVKGRTGETEGVIKSIYQEPMVQYVYKKYPKNQQALLLVQTSDREFVYQLSKKNIQIYLNNQPLGTLRPNGVLYDLNNRGVAEIQQDKTAIAVPIIVKNEEKGALVNLEKSTRENPRAFELLSPMQPAETDYFLALALLELTMQNVMKQ